jgi:5-methyltetrahydrofolate--homocysteine methyltransferase
MAMTRPFTIIGENIHASRVFLRKGRRITESPDGREAVRYRDPDGAWALLPLPEGYEERQVYDEGRVKHVMVAIEQGMSDDEALSAAGVAYLHYEARRQIKAGADFLDVNVDEVSPFPERQLAAMAWLVPTVQAAVDTPLSIDSSNPEIIAAGLDVYDRRAGRPIVNSASLERPETLGMVKERDGRVVASAFGATGMPNSAQERVDNVAQLLEIAWAEDIAPDDIYIDALVFPIATDPECGNYYLDAVRSFRDKYGEDVHITGGLSNVSFGIPARKIINEVFIYLALEAGIDSGIIDPLSTKLDEIGNMDPADKAFALAADALSGADPYCIEYLTAYRAGELD